MKLWKLVIGAHLAVFSLSATAAFGWFFGLRVLVRLYLKTGVL